MFVKDMYEPKGKRRGYPLLLAGLVFVFCGIFSTEVQGQDADIQVLTASGTQDRGVERIVRLSNGDYLLVGWIWRARSGKEAYVGRFSAAGQPVWQRLFSGLLGDWFSDAVEMQDGSLTLVGTTNKGYIGGADVLVVNFMADGTPRMLKVYGGPWGEMGRAVTVSPDNRIIIAAETESWGAGWTDVWLVQMWLNGDVIDAHVYGSVMPEEVYDVIPALDGPGYVIVGATMATRGGIDGFVLRVDSQGHMVWNRRFGHNHTERFYRVIPSVDVEPAYILIGDSEVWQSRYSDMLIVKLSVDGSQVRWARRFGGASWDYAYDGVQTLDYGFLLVGRSKSFNTAGAYDAFVVKTDWQGIPQWSKVFSTAFNDEFRGVYMVNPTMFRASGISPALSNANDILTATWSFSLDDTNSCAMEVRTVTVEVSNAPDHHYVWQVEETVSPDFAVQSLNIPLLPFNAETQSMCASPTDDDDVTHGRDSGLGTGRPLNRGISPFRDF